METRGGYRGGMGWYVYHPDQNTGGIYTPRNLHTYGWYIYHPTGGIYTTPGFLPIKFFSSPRFVLSRNVLIQIKPS